MSTTVLATDSAMPNTIPLDQLQPRLPHEHRAQHCGNCTLRDGAGNRDPLDRQQLVDVELEAHSEHQQDHTDFGKLLRERRVRNESWRIRSDGDPANRYPTIGDSPARCVR
jgi:hypothetical protein